jgi:hypothetical protein
LLPVVGRVEQFDVGLIRKCHATECIAAMAHPSVRQHRGLPMGHQKRQEREVLSVHVYRGWLHTVQMGSLEGEYAPHLPQGRP